MAGRGPECLAQRAGRLRGLGATHVLDRAGQGDGDAPAGYDVIIDIVAGEVFGRIVLTPSERPATRLGLG